MTSTAPLHVGSVHGARQVPVTVPAIAGARRPPPLRDSEAGTNHCPSCPMGHHHWGPTSRHWPLPRHVRSVHGPQHLHTLYQGYDGQHTLGNGQQASKLKSPHAATKTQCSPINKHFLKSFIDKQVQFSHSVVSNSLRPHGLQHTRPPCPSPTPRAYANSYPSSQ